VNLRRAVPLLALAFTTGHDGPDAGRDASRRRIARVPTAPPAVPREFRAAWATPIWDRGFRDWPTSPNMSAAEQRAELRTMLDRSAAAGLNAIILHVRLAGDALYPTSYAPWSVFLTGRSGVGPTPAYDPLAFAVQEAHARGLQLHAWFNPFRAMLPNMAGKASLSHVSRRHPEWIRKYGSQTWIDPGEPAARDHVRETILDVVKRYDVDGIHIDAYFYPYRESRVVTRRVRGKRVRSRVELTFPDDRTWKKYGRAKGFTDRDAWRRANINVFVEELYKDVKKLKPAMVVGISPFGIWRPGNPPGITGLDAFSEIYADSRRWLREGWLDYVAPQIYWEIGGTQDRFRVLDQWWRTQNPEGRHIWPGLYTSRVYGSGDVWPMREVAAQVAQIRDVRAGSRDDPGHVHFRLGALFANDNRLAMTLSDLYRERALVPAFPWLGAHVPAAPHVSLLPGTGAASFTITPGDSARVRWWLIQTRGRDGAWTTSLRPVGEGKLTAGALGTNDPDEIAVTAISATGVASTPTIITP
jgi:uncharacterized lipoprotein YddW (UPF0748 family)